EEEVGITRREKGKAKQEPVIKGILPETPAPVAAPRPEPRPVQAAAPAASLPVAAPPATAGGGFFSWVKSIFSVGEPAPTVAARPLALSTPATGDAPKRERDGRGERSDRGGDRGDRGGRGGRGGRRGERSAERPEGAAGEAHGRGRRGERGGDASKPESADGARGEGREAREPREGREPREAREPRAGRGERGDRAERGGQRGEPRQDGRGGDEHRGGRSDRASPNGEAVETPVGAEGTAPQAFVDTQPGDGTPSPQSGEGTEGAERQGGRRRNRRGGRGRDRDDTANGTELSPDAQVAQDGEAAPARNESAEGFDANVAGASGESGEARTDDSGIPGEGRGEGSGSRRRRGGRGRDRGPRESVSAEGESADGTPRDLAATPPEVWQAQERSEPHSFTERAAFEPAAQEPAAMPLFEPRDEEPRAQPTHMARVDAQEAPAPATPEPMAPAAAAVDYVLPMDSLNAVADGAGLQWVNSDVEKIRAAQAAMAAMPAPIPVSREIRKVELADEGPLVLVETRKDLSQVRLPFENQPPSA
ncbi:MAG: ribonuclease E/G, partial [Caldimonas sp.]